MNRTVAILLLGFTMLRATPSGATSVFSMVLLGERIEAGDTRSISLGGSTQLVADSLGVLQLNPALLAAVTNVMIGATNQIAVDEGRSTEYSERDVSVIFPAVRAAFPIADRFVLSIGYQGRYDPDGSLSLSDTTGAGVDVLATFRKSGGLYSVPITISFNVTRFASVGFTASLESGFVQERWDKQFAAVLFVPGAGFKKESLNGVGYGAGLVLKPTERIMVGGTFESKVDYDTDVELRYTTPGLDSAYTSTATLPARASVAATIGFSRQLRVAASYAYSDFTKLKGFGFDAARLQKEVSYAFGIEHDRAIPLPSGWIPLRLSFNYQELPFDHPPGTSVAKFLFGIGSGFQIYGGRGKVDYAFQVGRSGALNENGVEDRLFRMYVSVSGGESWKRRSGAGETIGR